MIEGKEIKGTVTDREEVKVKDRVQRLRGDTDRIVTELEGAVTERTEITDNRGKCDKNRRESTRDKVGGNSGRHKGNMCKQRGSEKSDDF